MCTFDDGLALHEDSSSVQGTRVIRGLGYNLHAQRKTGFTCYGRGFFTVFAYVAPPFHLDEPF